MLNLSGSRPCNVVANRRGDAARSEKLEVINHWGIHDMQLRRQAFNLQRVIGHLHHPKQAGRPNPTVEIVQLRGQARTGLEQVDSNENERSSMVRAVIRNVFAAKHAHVRNDVV